MLPHNGLETGQRSIRSQKMFNEIFLLSRGIEAYRLVEDCTQECNFRRSNAIRRKKQVEVGTLTKVKTAKSELTKCIKNCGLFESVDELHNTKNITG